MTAPEPTRPQAPGRKPARVGCGGAIVLCLICYVFSYPWVSAAVWKTGSPTDGALGSIVNAIYAPVGFAIDHNRAAFVFYRWYTETLNKRFPSYFEVPILVIDPSEQGTPPQIDPPPEVTAGE